MIELREERRHGVLEVREVDDPSELRVDGSLHVDLTPERVSVEAKAFVVGGDVGQPMCGLEAELLEDLHACSGGRGALLAQGSGRNTRRNERSMSSRAGLSREHHDLAQPTPMRHADVMQERPLELGFKELPEWIRRTVRADRLTRDSRPRPLSLSRLMKSVLPRIDSAIFVVGAPRSGTTFVGKCLAALPEVSYHYEPVVTKAAARHVYAGDWDVGRAALLYREAFRWLQRIHLEGDLVFAEKTPQDSFVVPFLSRAFRSSRFIHVLRDGRDVASSLLKKPWLRADAGGKAGRFEPGGFQYGPFARFWVEPDRRLEFETTSDARRCAWSWRRHVEASLEAQRVIPPHRWFELRYERLVDDPSGQAERLLDFLGIDRSTSRDALRAVVLGRDASRRGSFSTDLTPEQLSDVMFEAGALLRSLGYVDASER